MIEENFEDSSEGVEFDFSMLQLHDFPNVKIKIDSLFYDWLLSNIGEGGQSLLAELRQNVLSYKDSNKAFSFDVNSSSNMSNNSPSAKNEVGDNANSNFNTNNLGDSTSPSTVVPAASIYFAPPLSPNRKSPKKRLQSEMMLNNKSNDSSSANDSQSNDGSNVLLLPIQSPKSTRKLVADSKQGHTSEDDDAITLATTRRRSNFDSIPVFYLPGEGNKRKSLFIREEDSLVAKLPDIEAFFKPFKDGIPVDKFVHVTKRLCNFPSYFNVPFCERIFDLYGGNTDSSIQSPQKGPVNAFGMSNYHQNSKVTMKIFLQYWKHEMEPFDAHERFFRLIKQPNQLYIHQDDFLPYLHELLRFHPGLDFLDGHDEFQRKYALTVIARIFYKVNTSRTGKLSIREVRKSKLLLDFIHVDEETEINRVKEYFAYEHFYVLYCRFFELDLDKDLKLSRDDLIKYGDHSLSDAIIDRIFQVGQRAFSDGREGFDKNGGMSYPDFIYFMLAEEDKGSEQAIKYWFRCCDLDGDGVITPAEMAHFYKTQIHRLTSLGQESIQFRDVLCQMLDMLNPVNPNAITLKDFSTPEKRKAGGIIFDVLFNLNKFLRFEMRDPFQEKLRREDGFTCEWDRFAHFEYHRLAAEDDVSSNQQQQQYSYNMGNNRMGTGNINVVINGNDIDGDDDYNMFCEDDNDGNDTGHTMQFIHNIHANNAMDVDTSSNMNQTHNRGKNVVNNSNFGDWSLDDESDSDDDYQITGKYHQDSSNNMGNKSSQSGMNNAGNKANNSSGFQPRKGK